MVKQRRKPGGGDNYRDAVPQDQRFWLVNLETMTADQFDVGRSKRSPPLNRPQGSIEMLWCYRVILPNRR